jgi:hypothetical protein
MVAAHPGFQKSREPFQSGTLRARRTNLVLIRFKGSEYPEGQFQLSKIIARPARTGFVGSSRPPSRDQKASNRHLVHARLGLANLRSRGLNFLPEAVSVFQPVPITNNPTLGTVNMGKYYNFCTSACMNSEHGPGIGAGARRTVIFN